MVAAVLVVVALFTLGNPGTPKLSQEPPSFDGEAAYADLKTIVEDFPQRVAGSDPDNRMGIWVEQQFRAAGLETHIDGFAATVNGKDVALQNVWGVAKGRTQGTIMILANRDVPPLATQGAGDNASGVAAMIALADAFSVTAHQHTLIFLCTTGDAYGALGAHEFVAAHQTDDLYAVIALRDVAKRESDAVGVDGWSSVPKTAPPWLWLLTAPAAKRDSNMDAELPGVPAQVLRLAVPTGAGGQAPFVAAGVPAITVSAAGPSTPAQNDTLDTVSQDTLTDVGTAAQNMVMAVDDTTEPGAPSGGTIFLTRKATLPGGALAAILAALLLPLVAVTVDLFAHCRRTRIRLRPAFTRAGLHLAPWLVMIAIVYFANLVGLLPHSPDAVIPPDSRLAETPRYLRVVVLVALMALAYAYAVAVERRLERRLATDARATIFVSHLLLVSHRVAAPAREPVRGAPGAARRRPLAAGETRRVGALDPARVPGADHGAGAARLLRPAARHRLEGLVVLLPALREPHRPGGGRAAGGAVLLDGRRSRAHAARARPGAGGALVAGGGPPWPGPHDGRGMGGGHRGDHPAHTAR